MSQITASCHKSPHHITNHRIMSQITEQDGGLLWSRDDTWAARPWPAFLPSTSVSGDGTELQSVPWSLR